jgi:hypothetical protein
MYFRNASCSNREAEVKRDPQKVAFAIPPHMPPIALAFLYANGAPNKNHLDSIG